MSLYAVYLLTNMNEYFTRIGLNIPLSPVEQLVVAGIVLLLVLVLVSMLLLRRLRARQETDMQQLLSLVREQQQRIDESRKEVIANLNQHQTGLQQSVHQSVGTLESRLTQAQQQLQRQLLGDAEALKTDLIGRFQQLQSATTGELAGQRESFEKRQAEALKSQQEALTAGTEHISRQLRQSLEQFTNDISQRVDKLTRVTEERLKEISGQVEKRLHEGFEKTTETFSQVLQHLTRIDEAQKRITELSSNVVSLQEVLTDKRSRGAFGEVQMSALIRNLLPEGSFELQKVLGNGKRVDCLLYLPEPTGNVAVDAKFPLESFQIMSNPDASETERARATRQFRDDIRKHISDIAGKYIIPGETADGAVMFLPAEAVFAEIHARFPDLVEEAQRQRVWLVSPTTMMAILTTARAVIKDEATRRQVHIIQDHLRMLSADFGRFQKRMDNLSRHIRQAHEDVEQVHTSAKKISGRFEKIEQVELDDAVSLEDPGNVVSLPTED
ncbi:MAG: DNA recombination protein RmuC [bacterium]